MSLFKPSNFYPNLEEIDLKNNNIFSCQINSSGSSAKGYKIWFLSDDNIEILTSEAIKLNSPVKNKNFLNIDNLQNLEGYSKMTNGKNYKWGIRIYDAEIGSNKQPDTLICNGFIVGSTKNVIWTENNDKLSQNRWVEFKTTGSSSIMPILEPNTENLKLPEDGEEYIERKKIDWVTKELGHKKNITKIETTEAFTYNYINNTEFTIYQCSDQHGYNNIFVDPNDIIELGMMITIFNKETEVEARRKIIGYSEDTGEIRVQEPFNNIPKNGYTYKLYRLKDGMSSILPNYSPVDFSSSNVIGDTNTINSISISKNDSLKVGMYISIFNDDLEIEGKRKITEYSSETGIVKVTPDFSKIPTNGNTYKLYELVDAYEEVGFDDVSNIIGGAPIIDDSFKIITNVCDSNLKRLFIQPNINIKSDETNPNEIIFPNGVRVDIQKNMDEDIDITLDKLDNTQWLVTMPISEQNYPVIPQTKYQIFSDFMDSMPENIFYAKDTPEIILQYKNDNIIDEKYENISSETYKSFRDVKFNAIWNSPQNVQIKNYQYFLFDSNMNLISESNIIYNDEIVWVFRGLDTGKSEMIPNKYYIRVVIEDEYGKIFEIQEMFKVYYYIEETILPLEVVNNCERTAFDISFTVPIDVLCTGVDETNPVNFNNINLLTNILTIPNDKIANYTKLDSLEELYIEIPSNFSFMTSFQLNEEFIKSISLETDKIKEILSVGHKNSEGEIDIYSLRLGSFDRLFFYKDENEDTKIKINSNQFKLFLYKNNEPNPLFCFNQGEKNYLDLSKLEQGQDLIIPSIFSYALQDNSNKEYIVSEILPNMGEIGKKYVLTNEYKIRDTLYTKGIYIYSNERWKKDLTTEYIFIDKKSNLDSLDFGEIKIPDNCLESDNDTIKFVEENNIFIESSNVNGNAYLMSKKWIAFYFVVNNNNVIANANLYEERI